jgi:DNA-binding MarR family transcriptional regulator
MNTSSVSSDIHSLDLLLQSALDEALAPCGLSMAQWTALRAVHDQSGASGADLARTCGVTAQTMHTMLVSLERAGLVVRQPHAMHGRVVQVYLSNAGERRLAKGRAIVAEVEERALAALSGEERAILAGLLARVAGGLRQARRR